MVSLHSFSFRFTQFASRPSSNLAYVIFSISLAATETLELGLNDGMSSTNFIENPAPKVAKIRHAK